MAVPSRAASPFLSLIYTSWSWRLRGVPFWLFSGQVVHHPKPELFGQKSGSVLLLTQPFPMQAKDRGHHRLIFGLHGHSKVFVVDFLRSRSIIAFINLFIIQKRLVKEFSDLGHGSLQLKVLKGSQDTAASSHPVVTAFTTQPRWLRFLPFSLSHFCQGIHQVATKSADVSDAFVNGWIQWAGAPSFVLVDLDSAFKDVVRASAGQTHWQNGVAERWFMEADMEQACGGQVGLQRWDARSSSFCFRCQEPIAEPQWLLTSAMGVWLQRQTTSRPLRCRFTGPWGHGPCQHWHQVCKESGAPSWGKSSFLCMSVWRRSAESHQQQTSCRQQGLPGWGMTTW